MSKQMFVSIDRGFKIPGGYVMKLCQKYNLLFWYQIRKQKQFFSQVDKSCGIVTLNWPLMVLAIFKNLMYLSTILDKIFGTK